MTLYIFKLHILLAVLAGFDPAPIA